MGFWTPSDSGISGTREVAIHGSVYSEICKSQSALRREYHNFRNLETHYCIEGIEMKAIIHIGMPKTGTTSIQTWIKSNRVALEARSIHSFPSTVDRYALEHAIFVVATNEMGVDEHTAWQGSENQHSNMKKIIERNYQFLTSHLENLHGQSGIFICSLEVLYKRSELHMIALDKFLSRFFNKITYTVYIRDTVDFFVSMYSEKLRNFCPKYGSEEFSRFLSRCERNMIPFGTESSFGHLFKWNAVFGERLDVRLMEQNWLKNGDLIDDFASILGTDAIRKPSRMKESFAAEYIEFIRYLNRKFGRSLPEKLRINIRKILTAESAGKIKLAASDGRASSIHFIHREQDERIRKKFFPDRKVLFSSKSRGHGVIPPPLTDRRQSIIEGELREKMALTVWELYELFLRSQTK